MGNRYCNRGTLPSFQGTSLGKPRSTCLLCVTVSFVATSDSAIGRIARGGGLFSHPGKKHAFLLLVTKSLCALSEQTSLEGTGDVKEPHFNRHLPYEKKCLGHVEFLPDVGIAILVPAPHIL